MSQTPPRPQPQVRETWLWVLLVAFLPVVASLVVPERFKVPLLAIAGLLTVIGLALLAVVGRQLSKKPERQP